MSCATDSESRTVTCPSLLLFLAQRYFNPNINSYCLFTVSCHHWAFWSTVLDEPEIKFRSYIFDFRTPLTETTRTLVSKIAFVRALSQCRSLVITGHRRDSNVIINARRAPTKDRVSSNVDQCVYAKTSACESRGKERLEWNQ